MKVGIELIRCVFISRLPLLFTAVTVLFYSPPNKAPCQGKRKPGLGAGEGGLPAAGNGRAGAGELPDYPGHYVSKLVI